MSADLDADVAVRSLARRLQDWGIDQPFPKARAFIDDMQERGWRMSLVAGPRRNPQPHEECGKHPGQYQLWCGGCAADRRALVEERDAADRETAHLTATTALAACRDAVRDSRGVSA